MSRVCGICGKGTATGNNNITHPEKKKTTSNHKTRRTFRPNLFKKLVFDPDTGLRKKMKICAQCVRSLVKVR